MSHDDKNERLWLKSGKFIARTERGGFELCYDDGSYCRSLDPYLETDLAEMLFQSAPSAIAPPTDKEIAAYRDLFRVELDKNMNNSSSSPSTEAHGVALRRFVAARNAGAFSDGKADV